MSDDRIFEYRRYQSFPGKLAAISARFENHVMAIFARHGFRCVGFWETYVGDSGQLHYLLEWPNLGERQRAWDSFNADAEWQAVRAESEKAGPIVSFVHNELWKPTRFSPRTTIEK